MPKSLDKCVKKIEKKIKQGKMRKTFLKRGKKVASPPYAICVAQRRKK